MKKKNIEEDGGTDVEREDVVIKRRLTYVFSSITLDPKTLFNDF